MKSKHPSDPQTSEEVYLRKTRLVKEPGQENGAVYTGAFGAATFQADFSLSPLSQVHKLPPGVRAILFDLDDTLYDRETAYHTWATTFVRTTFPASDACEAQEIVALLVKLDRHGYASREAVFAGLRQRYPLLTTPLSALIAEYDSAFIAAIEESQAARALLQALVAAAIPFGIVTNGSPRQQQKIARLGLDRLTSCIFISHFFGAKKPDPAIFLAAAAHLGLPPGEILFVGDHPYNDIWGAHQAGMRTAWLRRASSWWPETLPETSADLTLHSLVDLL